MTTANANGIQIEYETFGDSASPALLLVMGLGCQLIHWQDELCKQISDVGYYVIRYDNRDVGLSTKFDGLTAEEIMEMIGALFMGQKVTVPYTIEDMAEDAAGLLDALSIDRAHICGMSLGGYIAQTFAINNPSRTLSLTSIYSTPGNNSEYPPSQEVMEAMMQPMPKEREPYIEYMLKIHRLTFGTGLPFDEEFHRSITNKAYDRSVYPEGTGRQYLARMAQKNRTDDLGKLTVPSLVIHGDADPLVPIAGGQATADAIPGAKFMVVKGMGHALPNVDAYWDKIRDAMIKHMERAT